MRYAVSALVTSEGQGKSTRKGAIQIEKRNLVRVANILKRHEDIDFVTLISGHSDAHVEFARGQVAVGSELSNNNLSQMRRATASRLFIRPQ